MEREAKPDRDRCASYAAECDGAPVFLLIPCFTDTSMPFSCSEVGFSDLTCIAAIQEQCYRRGAR